MKKIFLSYKQRDPKYGQNIERVYENLCAEGFSVFRDVVGLKQGENWVGALNKAIAECDVGVVIWTPASAGSESVTGEAIKLRRAKKYAGVILENDSEPAQFAAIQSAELFDWMGGRDDARWRALVEHIKAFKLESPLSSSTPIEQSEDAAGQGLIKGAGGAPDLFIVRPQQPWQMGSPDEGDDNNAPRVSIHSAKPFAIGLQPVTLLQWNYAIDHGARNLSRDRPALGGDDANAVVGVTWREAQSYVDWLSYRTGGEEYRLPSEAEWEYCARQFVNKGSSLSAHTKDWLGAVWQWVADSYADTHEGAPTDGSPRVVRGSFFRAARGGSWRSPDFQCRPFSRTGFRESLSADDVGFRIARELDEGT